MTVYTVRPGFTIVLPSGTYTGGQSVDLNDTEFSANKHKLEGIERDEELDLVIGGNSNPVVDTEKYRSAELPYTNGSLLRFTHDWDNFDPASPEEWHHVQPYAVCVSNDRGWAVGERALLTVREGCLEVTPTQIRFQVANGGVRIIRKDGNRTEFAINRNKWRIYVIGERKRG